MKVAKDALLDNRMEESGIFLFWAGRPIMINSVLEGLRQSRLDDIHLEIWFSAESRWAIDVEKEDEENDMKSWVYRTHRDGGQQKRTLLDDLTVWCIELGGAAPGRSLEGPHRRVGGVVRCG